MQLRSLWDSYWGRVIGGSVALFGLLPSLLVAWKGSEYYTLGVYIGTGVAIVWYTVETSYLRRAMIQQNQLAGEQLKVAIEQKAIALQQNEIAIQPLLVVTIEERQTGLAPRLTFGPQMAMRNIGRGPALFIRIRELVLTDLIDGLRFLVKFETLDCLEPGKDHIVRASFTYEGPAVRGEVPEQFDFVASLNPASAVETYEVVVEYEDTSGQRRGSVVQMGRAGVRLLRHA